MRKSKYVSLLLAGATATTLVACGQRKGGDWGEDSTLYGDSAACARDMDSGVCNEAYRAAKDEHAKQAPKFDTQAECEAAGYTQCDTTEVRTADGGSRSMFMPMMMGFMMGRMLGGGMGGGFPARPVYGDRNGYLHANGQNVGRVAPGTTSLGPNGIAMRTARGGFGSSARSSGGGS
jgi:uncharacterized protein YgiB involved in biofilm formation